MSGPEEPNARGLVRAVRAERSGLGVPGTGQGSVGPGRCPSALGQAASGTVSGTVTDQAGATVPGAAVTLVNEGTQFSRTVVTNQSVQYVAQFFPLGKIRITVEQPGFQKLVRQGAELTARPTAGQISATQPARTMQLALKATF